MTKQIVFIHGLFENPKSWTTWKQFFSSHGFECHVPAYPFHDGEPAELRKNVTAKLGTVTFAHVVNSLASFIGTLAESPILIGHSMGGLAVQKLISMNKGAAGICIDSAPPMGVFTFQWSFLRANFPTINPFKGNSICLPTVEWFHYAFCNVMTIEETKKEYEEFVVPESRNIPRSSALNDGRIDFKKPHAPLLFIAGEKDNIIPSSLNKKNFLSYQDTASKREFKEFPNRSHYICGQKGWDEVAEYCRRWIQQNVQ